MASKKAKAAKARRDRRGGNGAPLRPAPDRGRGPARQPARRLRRGAGRLRPGIRREAALRRARGQEPAEGPAQGEREPARRDRRPARAGEEGLEHARPAAAARDRRRDPGARPERGPAQDGARPAVRRRGGVRVQLDDLRAALAGEHHLQPEHRDRHRIAARARARRRARASHRRRDALDASPRTGSAARRSSASRARRTSAAGSCTTTSGPRSGCSSRSSVATARSGSAASRPRSLAARSSDDVLDVLVSSLLDLIENEPGFFVLLFELFTAGRRNPEMGREVGRAVPQDASPGRDGAGEQGRRGRDHAPLRRRGHRLLPVRDRRRLRRAGALRPRPRSRGGSRGGPGGRSPPARRRLTLTPGDVTPEGVDM